MSTRIRPYRIAQFWAKLGIESLTAEQYLWSDDHANLVRQWRELAFWFPGLSGAAGRQRICRIDSKEPCGLGDEDLTTLVSDLPSGSLGRLSHSFATEFPLSRVWDVYWDFRRYLR
jgi:hypothetical protein